MIIRRSVMFFFFKQKTAYEMRISDWSSDVCSSDLGLGRPVLFTQTRAGRNGRPFRLVKFRTMTDARDRDGRLLPDEERLTRLGRFLRRSRVDELPELWNIMKGAMRLRSEEHTSELPSLLRISYAVFCLNTQKTT